MKLIEYNKTSKLLIKKILSDGGVIAHPTDTCFGLAADFTNKKAVEKVIKIKKMVDSKPMSIIVPSINDISIYAVMSKLAKEIATKYMPGAITLLIPKTKNIPSYYYPETSLIGIRVPDIFLTRDLTIQSPVTTTSANITGTKELYTASEVFNLFKNNVYAPDIVLDVKTSLNNRNKPSTIVKIVGETIAIIRQGDIIIN